MVEAHKKVIKPVSNGARTPTLALLLQISYSKPPLLKMWPQASSIIITWELVRNVDS